VSGRWAIFGGNLLSPIAMREARRTSIARRFNGGKQWAVEEQLKITN
jgi:hypothetical protein